MVQYYEKKGHYNFIRLAFQYSTLQILNALNKTLFSLEHFAMSLIVLQCK